MYRIVPFVILTGCTESRLSWPGPLEGAMGGLIDRELWVFGGVRDGGERSAEVWSIDLDVLRWERHPDMPSTRAFGAAAFDGASVFMVVGGCQGDGCDPVIRFDPLAQAWTPLASGPGNRLSPGLAIYGETAWVFGGIDPATTEGLRDVWSYADGWTSWGPYLLAQDADADPTLAGGGDDAGYIVTSAAGLLTTWSGASVLQVQSFPSVPDCLWADDDAAFVWSEGDVHVCNTNLTCEPGELDLRPGVPGALCAPVDETLWTFGGVETGAVTGELWRFHDEIWEQVTEGGEAIESPSQRQ